MPLHLAPGERAAPGAEDAAARALADPRVAAVLVPIVPTGDGAVPRAAARLMRAWDARLLHDDTWYALGARVATSGGRQVPGWRAADAAPILARALDAGERVVALRSAAVESPVARDLDAWVAWAREEGAAWGALARREPRFARVLVATTRRAWWSHNVVHVSRRAGEAAQALRRADPAATYLHLLREATFSGAAVRAMGRRG